MKKKGKAKERKARAKRGTKARSKAAKVVEVAATSNGSGIPPVPKSGPNLTLRARSQGQIDKIKRAAGKENMSMNTWAIEVLDRAAQVATK